MLVSHPGHLILDSRWWQRMMTSFRESMMDEDSCVQQSRLEFLELMPEQIKLSFEMRFAASCYLPRSPRTPKLPCRENLAMSQELFECFWPFQVCKWAEIERDTRKSQQTATRPCRQPASLLFLFHLTSMKSWIFSIYVIFYFFSSPDMKLWAQTGQSLKGTNIRSETGRPFCGSHVFTH